MDVPAIAPDKAALFLDFDGTLVEIAARPDAVAVPPGLPALLHRLASRLGGALAVVSGRPLTDLQARLPVRVAMAGDHGSTLRPDPDDAPLDLALPSPPPAWRHQAEAMARRFPGALVEVKAHGFVLHYRLAPEAGPAGGRLLEALTAGHPDFLVMPARMAWEVKPRAVSKGSALAALMARAPFAGRCPVFIGDDATDEAGMAAARQAGGIGLRLQDSFGTPAALRGWLSRLAAGAPAR